jgi:hypothetical protein
MNFLQRREVGVEALDLVLEPRHVRVGDGHVPGNRKLAAQVEEVVLDAREAVDGVLGKRFGEQQPERRVELVDAPIASIRAESLATREPSPRPVVPLSPVRVTILERRWPMRFVNVSSSS